jgi:acetylornithine deacetylase/succinyl-diaminopimelate desuccinylase-like protein
MAASEPQLGPFFDWVDKHEKDIIDLLAESVAIPSVSGEKARRPETVQMTQWTAEHLKTLGVTVEVRDNPKGTQELEGETVPLPPLVLGTYGTDASKPTICVYGHLDVVSTAQFYVFATRPS